MLEYSIIVRLSHKRSKNEGKLIYMLFFANRFSVVYVLLKILRIDQVINNYGTRLSKIS